MMSISLFGHKALGDLLSRQDVFTSRAHLLHRGFLAIHFVKVKWYHSRTTVVLQSYYSGL
jgi:hypothetical protein